MILVTNETKAKMLTRILIYFYILLIIIVIILANYGQLGATAVLLKQIPYGDKWGHFFLIGLLAVLVNHSWKWAQWHWRGWGLLKGSFWVTLFVTLEEFSQYFIQSRTFDLGDLIFDYLGIAVLSSLGFYLWQFKKQRLKKFS